MPPETEPSSESLSPQEVARRKQNAERAKTSTDLFIPLRSLHGPYQRVYREGKEEYIVNKESGLPLRRFPRSQYRGGEKKYYYSEVPAYTFSVSKAKFGKTVFNLPAEYITSYANDETKKDEIAFIEEIVTTPLEGMDEESLMAVINGFHFIPPESVAPNYGAYGNYQPFSYTYLLDSLLPIFKEATHKKYFLEYLFDWLWWKGKEGVSMNTAGFIKEWFKNNASLFGKKMTPEGMVAFRKGDRALGRPPYTIWPNANGVYTLAAEPNSFYGGRGRPLRPDHAIDVTFYPGHGWYYHPRDDEEKWRPLKVDGKISPDTHNYSADHEKFLKYLYEAAYGSK